MASDRCFTLKPGAEILQGDVWRACVYDCPAYCWRSLGLGHTAGAEILQGDVWRDVCCQLSAVSCLLSFDRELSFDLERKIGKLSKMPPAAS